MKKKDERKRFILKEDESDNIIRATILLRDCSKGDGTTVLWRLIPPFTKVCPWKPGTKWWAAETWNLYNYHTDWETGRIDDYEIWGKELPDSFKEESLPRNSMIVTRGWFSDAGLEDPDIDWWRPATQMRRWMSQVSFEIVSVESKVVDAEDLYESAPMEDEEYIKERLKYITRTNSMVGEWAWRITVKQIDPNEWRYDEHTTQ